MIMTLKEQLIHMEDAVRNAAMDYDTATLFEIQGQCERMLRRLQDQDNKRKILEILDLCDTGILAADGHANFLNFLNSIY